MELARRFVQIFRASAPGPRLALLALVALIVLLGAAACGDETPGSGPARATEDAANNSPALVAATPVTPTPTATATATSTSTPSPTPTATPTAVAAQALAALPAGQVLLTLQRDSPGSAELWHLPAGGALALLWPDVAGDLWACAGQEALTCAAVGVSGGVQFFPSGREAVLLDSLPSREDAAPATALALSPDARLLAVSTQEDLRVLDAEEGRPLLTLAITGTTALRWAPGDTTLAVRFSRGGGDALALWREESFDPRVVLQMDRIGQFVWSHAGDKLAVIASHAYPPDEPVRQASDLFVLYLGSGEIRNFTESTMPYPGRAAVDALDPWPLTWTADDLAVRYVRGAPDDPATATVVLHPLDAFRATPLWPAAEEGELGLRPSPGGQYQARLVEQGGQPLVQVREGEGDWEQALAVKFHAPVEMMWAPADADGSATIPILLVVEPQALWLLDVPNAQVGKLVAACESCQIIRAAWLP